MKKAYVKPEIELESFQFSANVAGGCDNILSAEQIEYDKLNGGFANGEDSCGIEIGCYHGPSGEIIFTS